MSERLRSARLVAAAGLGLLLFNYPFLALAETDRLIAGVPVQLAYLFLVWALVIALVGWVARS